MQIISKNIGDMSKLYIRIYYDFIKLMSCPKKSRNRIFGYTKVKIINVLSIEIFYKFVKMLYLMSSTR